jgi:hypothetical protein
MRRRVDFEGAKPERVPLGVSNRNANEKRLHRDGRFTQWTCLDVVLFSESFSSNSNFFLTRF